MLDEFSSKKILGLTWPTIVSYSMIILAGITDLLFIRKLGTVAIATVATANSFIVGIYSFMEGIKSGTTVITAKYFGARDKDQVSRTLNIAFLSALIMGALLFILAPVVAKLIYFIIADKQIRQFNNFSYLLIRLLAAPLILILYALIGFFNGLKKTRIPLYLTLVVLLINVFLDLIFVWGYLGLPQMGTTGAAVATAISYFIAAMIGFVFLIKNKVSEAYIKLTLGIKCIKKEYIKIALDIGLYAGLPTVALLFFIAIFSSLGAGALAVHQVTFQVLMIAHLIPAGFFIASSILIGKLVGEKKVYLVNDITLKIAKICVCLVLILSFFTFISSNVIAKLFFLKNPKLLLLTSKSIKLMSIESVIGAFYLVLKGCLTGTQDTRFIFTEAVITSFFLFIPLTYLLGITFEYGVVGGYFAYFIWTGVDTSILSWRFFVCKSWKRVF